MKKADQHIAEPIVGSCLVAPKGGAKGVMASAVAGELGGSAARAASDQIASTRHRDASPLEPGTTSIGLLALTADDVVLLNGRRGMVKPVATGLAGRAPRRSLVAAELGKGALTAPLRLSFQDGSSWELAVPRAEGKRARALIDELGVS
ncbi:MAG TPA: hypothetical protein VK307_02120 [Thermoleophilaceae bacterium]|nr:hypothetical protein [Thermoleophilaceae bacterium]